MLLWRDLTLEFEWQTRCHQHDLVACGRDKLVQAPLFIAEMASERVVGNDAGANFIGNKK